jgi:type II secretory pathway pseudopilin PulG
MNKMKPTTNRRAEAGFTLVETLVAIVVLIFGLMAVTNLLLVAASSNSAANQSSAATSSATQVMDMLKSTHWNNLVAGGDVTSDIPAGVPVECNTLTSPPPNGVYNCDDMVAGVGRIHTRWAITAVPGTNRLLQIAVRSEGTGPLAVARSRADFTTYRACTNSADGSCPLPGNALNRCCPL